MDKNNIILEKDIFLREKINERMVDGGFNSISKFELFIWDLEIFLQLQARLGDKIILKGGAATQFYIPVAFQRTSIDIDMICLVSPEEIHKVIYDIENELAGNGDYFKFRLYIPKKPRIGLDMLETYYMTVPSICSDEELYATKGKQEVKIEFIFLKDEYEINKIKNIELFALATKNIFNILAFENLFADKLTTIGPNTIGVSDDRMDEQIKQIYDIITLFINNIEKVLDNKKLIQDNYRKVAKLECQIHNIEYDETLLFEDMRLFLKRLQNIENDNNLLQKANDFQALYLRKSVNRDKAEWVIVGYQLELLINYIFNNDQRLYDFKQIEELIETLQFAHIKGPERGKQSKKVREILAKEYESSPDISEDLFRKRIDRIIWELIMFVDFKKIKEKIDLIIK